MIQSEWIFLKHLTWDTEDEFAGVEKILMETVLPCIFFRNKKPLPPIVGALSMMPVKKSGLGLLNTVTPEKEKYLSSQRRSGELIRAVTGGGAFSNDKQLLEIGEESRDVQKKLGCRER